jgi:hypothetical protein
MPFHVPHQGRRHAAAARLRPDEHRGEPGREVGARGQVIRVQRGRTERPPLCLRDEDDRRFGAARAPQEGRGLLARGTIGGPPLGVQPGRDLVEVFGPGGREDQHRRGLSRVCDRGIRPSGHPFSGVMHQTTGATRRAAARPTCRHALCALLAALLLPACSTIDERLRRIDVLDRVFEPSRFRQPPPPQAVQVMPQLPADPVPAPGAPPVWAEPVPQPAPVIRTPEPPPIIAEPIPDPEPPRPQVDPEVRRNALIRQNPWLARFWGELTPAQQGRVSRAIIRSGRPQSEAAPSWDRMGLAERTSLVFG